MEQKKPGRIRLGRDFAMVLIGQIISMFGSAVIRFALPVWAAASCASPRGRPQATPASASASSIR